MVEQSVFLDTLNSVKDIVATSETPMKESEILAYFKDMELNEKQRALVLSYLLNPDNYKTEERGEDSGAENSADAEKINVYQMYLDEVNEVPEVSEEELSALYRRLLQGDAEAVHDISSAWLSRVTRIAEEYADERLAMGDLVQEGNVALLVRLSELCGSMSKVSVDEELSAAVAQGILQYVSRLRDEREMEDTIVGKVNLVRAATDILTEEHGRVPTTEELSEYTKMSAEELSGLQELIDEAGRGDE